jgi:hypothetical protein
MPGGSIWRHRLLLIVDIFQEIWFTNIDTGATITLRSNGFNPMFFRVNDHLRSRWSGFLPKRQNKDGRTFCVELATGCKTPGFYGKNNLPVKMKLASGLALSI